MSLYKETLMKHFRNPEYKFETLDANFSKDGVNPSCGDSLTLFIDYKDNKVTNISYTGSGCAISMASADILCHTIKRIENPLNTIADFRAMITGEDISFPEDLKILEVFKEMQAYPARHSCALLAWNTLEEVLKTTGA